MDHEWNNSQPIYRQLRDRSTHMILDGVLKEGDPLPSVRTVAAEFRVNPLTVLKAYQASAKSFSRKNGLASTPPLSASASNHKNCSTPSLPTCLRKQPRRKSNHGLY